MAVTILGSFTDPTVLGGPVTVTTGTGFTTLPIASPITITGSGANADSYWNLSGSTLVPENLNYKVGLGLVENDTLTDNYFLIYDDVAHEIRKITTTELAVYNHTHVWSDITSGIPTTLSGYGITDAQPIDATLTALAGLNATAGFVIQTGADTFTKDTNTYSLSSHTHDPYVLPIASAGTLGGIKVGAYLTIDGNGVLNAQPPGGGGSEDFDEPEFTTSFGFATNKWRIVEDGNNILLKFDGVSKGKLENNGKMSFTGDVVAFATL